MMLINCIALLSFVAGLTVGPQEKTQQTCAHLSPEVVADLRKVAQQAADEGKLRKHILKAMRTWSREHGVEENNQTRRCISAISRATGAPDKPAPVVDSQRLDTPKQLEAVLEQGIHDAYVRRELDRIWEAYRRLQLGHKLDQSLREKVRAFVLRLYGRLPEIGRNVEPPYDRKRSAKWNRKNRSKPVRTFDSSYSGAHIYRYEKPYQLVAVGERINDSEEWEDNGRRYIILSLKAASGKRIIVKLPKSTSRWDHRIESVSMLAELQEFARTIRGCHFDTVLVPLSISGEFRKPYVWLGPGGRPSPFGGPRLEYSRVIAYREEGVLDVE
jgi:hypothetical protein